MNCVFILTKGKNKGNNCNINGKKKIINKTYCSRHYKKQEELLINHELVNMKKEDNNSNLNNTKKEDTNINLNSNLNNIKKPENIKKELDSPIEIKGYDVLELLGKGEFGRVYKIQDIETNNFYVIKMIENKHKKESISLYFEYNLLLNHFHEKRNVFFPELGKNPFKSYKKTDIHTYIFLEHFEETLQQRFINNKKVFTETQIKSYGTQLIDIIEYIHKKLYIYIDIKPENIMFKDNKTEEVKLVDFGLCQKYTNILGNHVVNKKLSNPIGTDLYSSIQMSNAKQPSRIDDIECIGYLMLYLHNGDLPWPDCTSIDKVLYKKKNITKQKIFKNSPEYIQKFILLTQEKNTYGIRPSYIKFKDLLN